MEPSGTSRDAGIGSKEKCIIDEAIDEIDETSTKGTDGKWLEHLTARVAPHLKEWDIDQAWLWADWEEREDQFPGTTNQDVGIDVVAKRRSDGEYVAIQCKSRQLDETGRGANIHKAETDKFVSTTSGPLWSERWIVTNGDNRLSLNIGQALAMHDRPLKVVNVRKDLSDQKQNSIVDDDSQTDVDGESGKQSKTSMQNEAISESVRILREHERTESGGLPVGQARGKIILPCGTGKTRISLRIVEELTAPGELSVVLCPSIALVAQIRREYLLHSNVSIRALAVCSDETAGYDPKKEDRIDTFANPLADNSNFSASEVKGKVTTDAQEIASWITQGRSTDAVNVIFGTYQSGRRVADALKMSKTTAKILIADEAHRTAGLRRKNSKSAKAKAEAEQLRDFTLCHDNDEFPATYRVYQTATPKVFGVKNSASSDWIVRTMDDETIFGVELYRKSYPEAVRNGWLADYRIIALGVNDAEAYNQANLLASGSELKGRQKVSSAQYLRGLVFALAMGGATEGGDAGNVPINSCIAFMNSVAKSKEFADRLQSRPVRDWVQNWLRDNSNGQNAKHYSFEHLDATSNVMARDKAKERLAEASEESPYGIINVGIFGEGTDSPSLNAVAFLEARKSPIDVIQAVGRAMRTAPEKDLGYIICPILIPPNADPEKWLSTSEMDEGWKELGQILMALRSHDQRIEDELSELLTLYLPKEPEVTTTITAVVNKDSSRIQYRQHTGRPGEAEEAVERVLNGKSTLVKEFEPLVEDANSLHAPGEIFGSTEPTAPPAPTQIVSGKMHEDGSAEMRMDTVARGKPAPDGTAGTVDIQKSKVKARKMINDGEGIRIEPPSKKPPKRRSREEIANEAGMQMVLLSGLGEYGNAIKVNLLAKSGLSSDRVMRDLNLLETGINEASFHLRSDDLVNDLNEHFGLDHLNEASLKKQADGCTTAALLLMNAAMLHQRISAGRWLSDRISDLSEVKNDANVVQRVTWEWYQILSHDFRPVVQPALDVIRNIENTGKTAGLERALRHIVAEAERIAETYADMGADHAGPLFNKVMGNQASDGAYFTRPVAASIAARLTLDACGEQDWTNIEVWRKHKTVDLACGSGTLLAALLTDMKRRAKAQGAGEELITQLQKIAVEDTIKGMDINPVSLQLAASQLTTGNQDTRYRQMGLHQMPYGPDKNEPTRVSAGTIELLGQRAIVERPGELDIVDDLIRSQHVWTSDDDFELEDAVKAAQNARVVIMNPPYTNRAKMGEKFPKHIQQSLRKRVDGMERILVASDPAMDEFVDKNALGPLFVALADRCLHPHNGLMTILRPTIALSNPSGLQERVMLAKRFHIHTVVTVHHPRTINLSQNTNINESILLVTRHKGDASPTRVIALNKLPINEDEVGDLHKALSVGESGEIPNGWGEVSHWPARLIETGDWTAAVWRSPKLANAALRFATDPKLHAIRDLHGVDAQATGRTLRGAFEKSEPGVRGSFPILKSKSGTDGQRTIQSIPDEHWISKKWTDNHGVGANEGDLPTDSIMKKAGYLLITAGQDNSTARVTATADEKIFVGNGWMPITGISEKVSKAFAVFVNSTAGRLQLMRNPGRKITFPEYSAAEARNLRVPNPKDTRAIGILADCWDRTKKVEVPQFRDGECEVRRLWDEAVAEAMHWDPDELSRLRHLLHREPHVSGLGYNQYADEVED